MPAMVVTLLKIFFLYLLFLMAKNVFKGLLTVRAFQKEAKKFSAQAEKEAGYTRGAQKPKGEVFEAEYRVVSDDSKS